MPPYMPKAVFVNLSDLGNQQVDVMHIVDDWSHKNRTPIPHKVIIKNMEKKGIKMYSTVFAINALIRKGYIRRAVVISNKSFYVQQKRL